MSPGNRRWRLAIALLLVPAMVLALGFALFLRELKASSGQRGAARADGIVALTGGAQRINDAVELLASGQGRRLLISGVNLRVGREDIARINPDSERWIDCCIDLGYRARNTIGNAIETRRWVRTNHFTSLLVVTSNYHMPRSLLELGHALPDVKLIPHPVDNSDFSGWWRDPALTRLLAVEYAKYLVAAVRTRIEGDPERSRVIVLSGGRRPVIASFGP